VEEGDVLSYVDLGVLVTFGITHIRVQREPKVGVLSTGNELNVLSSTADDGNQHSKESQFPPKEGLVYDINRPVLLSLLSTETHVRTIDYGIALDDIDLLERKIRCALEECDVLITTGGISTGEKDLLQSLVTETIGARLHFGRLNMKPGKPTTFFTWKNPERQKSQTKFIFALPGNPVSAFVCFNLLVSPALNLLHSPIRHQYEHHVSGIQDKDTPNLVDTLVQNSVVHNEVTAVISQKLSLDVERPEYHRVVLSWDASNSTFVATSTGVQRSSRFLSLKGADGLLVLPQGIPGRKMWCYPGEKHLCLLLNGQNYSWNSSRGIKWKDSMHKVIFDTTPCLQHQESAQKPISVPVEILCVGVSSDAAFIEKTIVESLSSKESRYSYEIKHPMLFPSSENFLEYLRSLSDETDASNLRLWIIASDCNFQEQVKFSSLLRSLLEKRADAMAMVARRKMAEECALSALFEVVVGWYKRRLIVCLPQSGIENPIRSLEPLIAHALLLNISA
jgi:molybdenum cofactor synthesis domain-containing protein